MKDRLTAQEAIDRIMDICEQLDPTVIWSAKDAGFAPKDLLSRESETGTFSLQIEYGNRKEQKEGQGSSR